jgi:aspartyl/asparaginyl beta-hydroxylase (cupin superfamily)
MPRADDFFHQLQTINSRLLDLTVNHVNATLTTGFGHWRQRVRAFSMTLRKRMSGLALECSRKAISSFNGFCARYSKVGNHEVFDHRDFPWLPAIEADWRKVRAELDAILPYIAHMQNFHDVLPNYSIRALPKYLTQGEGWKKYFFYAYGLKAPKNCRRCPETVKLLKRIPGMKTAFFSILGPYKYVPAHRGPFKGVLRLLLPLRIPEPAKKCGIRVGAHTRIWEEGKALVFDDTVRHEVWNHTDGVRAVLLVEVVRPMRFPANLVNAAVIWLIAWSPFMLGNARSYLRWERRFEAIVNADEPARRRMAPDV